MNEAYPVRVGVYQAVRLLPQRFKVCTRVDVKVASKRVDPWCPSTLENTNDHRQEGVRGAEL